MTRCHCVTISRNDSARKSKGRQVTSYHSSCLLVNLKDLLFAWHHSSASLWSRLRTTHLPNFERNVISALVNKLGDSPVCSLAWVWIRHLFSFVIGLHTYLSAGDYWRLLSRSNLLSKGCNTVILWSVTKNRTRVRPTKVFCRPLLGNTTEI